MQRQTGKNRAFAKQRPPWRLLGPKSVAAIDFFDLNTDVRCSNLGERAGKPLVVAQESFIEFENIHD